MSHAHYEVFTDAEGFARWRKRAANGEILATSEAYAPTSETATSRFNRRAAEDGIMADLAASLEIAARLPLMFRDISIGEVVPPA